MSKDKLLELAVQEVKNYVFNENRRMVCISMYCPNLDAYCPTYDCGLLDRYKRFTDRQWANAIKPYLNKYIPHDIGSIDNVAEFALGDLRFRRPRG